MQVLLVYRPECDPMLYGMNELTDPKLIPFQIYGMYPDDVDLAPAMSALYGLHPRWMTEVFKVGFAEPTEEQIKVAAAAGLQITRLNTGSAAPAIVDEEE